MYIPPSYPVSVSVEAHTYVQNARHAHTDKNWENNNKWTNGKKRWYCQEWENWQEKRKAK